MPGWGAARAHALGLVNRLVEPGDVLTAAFELAMAMTLSAPAAVTHMMLGLERIEPPEDVGWSATAAGMEVVLASADRLEGKAAFAERREPRWSPTPPESPPSGRRGRGGGSCRRRSQHPCRSPHRRLTRFVGQALT